MSDPLYPVFKPIDGPWIALLIIGILMFLFSVAGIFLLLLLWRRLAAKPPVNNANQVLSNRPTGNISIPVQFSGHAPQSYETQKMEVFVPQVDDMLYPHFTPDDAIDALQNTYQRTRAYF